MMLEGPAEGVTLVFAPTRAVGYSMQWSHRFFPKNLEI